ncbi:protein of unknown function DUF1995 [Halothece sp. PCC 7418]|uniref:DUF1995 family protein n=1 Tax=Halothece sp. (strain PCC 7418) TaxID=65093 RepID=UPI0002A089A4|nr:DUF1995 family protein [Halothece sp. PCC 7418]AFZ42769.1 protein of unknown function DUF1995 [Halothece sp. PCC 7418]
MMEFPVTLESAIAQAKQSTLTALEAGLTRLQVELRIPEIALQGEKIAKEFADLLEDDYGSGLKVLFPDTGAAALARRNWADVSFQVNDLGSRNTPIEKKVSEDDQMFLLVSPSAVEVQKVEKLCNLAGDRPVILLIPQLEDVATVGIGYAARQLRERFLSTLESCYYLQPLEEAALLKRYPSSWQLWIEKGENNYEFFCEEPEKPVGDTLDRLLRKASGEDVSAEETPAFASKPARKQGIFNSLQRFLKALSQ